MEAGAVTPLMGFDAMNGLSDQRCEIFTADEAAYQGEPEDSFESSRVEWVAPDRVLQLVRDGFVSDGCTIAALLWWLTLAKA